MSLYLSLNKLHSVHPSSISAGGLILLTNFQKGGAWQDLSSQDLRGWLLGKIEVTFFGVRGEGVAFLHIKSEIFNDQKGL